MIRPFSFTLRYRRYLEPVDFVIVVVDINDLKLVNDTYGHDYGDKLIQNGAAILKKVWRSDFIYRVGGDEFVILYSDVKAEWVEKKILLFEEAIEDYNRENACKELYLQMAIGAAVYDGKTDEEYADVFRRADSIMYEDKKEKKLRAK